MASRSPLLSGIRALLTCDSGEVVSGIVDFVTSQRRILRVLSHVMHRAEGTRVAVGVILLNALRCYVGVSLTGRGDSVVVARRPNERRAVAHLARLVPARAFAELAIEWSPAAATRALAALRPARAADRRRIARFTRRLMRRYGVFRALRALELVAYYRRYCELLADRRFELAVMSSHSNPHGIALNLAARRLRMPVVLITHGMPIRPLAALHYDVAIHECDASRRIYADAGCRMAQTVVKSRRADYAPMRLPLPSGRLTVGILLSKDPVEARVVRCLRALLADSCVGRILVRPHPVNLWRGLAGCVASLGDARVVVDSTASLAATLRACDLVVAGNSTVLLDAAVAGTPACYVRGLDHGPYDVQDFVRDGLIYESHLPATMERRGLERFYGRDGWRQVLQRYADVQRSDEDVADEIRRALKIVTAAEFGAVA